MVIREIRQSDAEEFLNLCRRIDEETPFMLFEPGERPTTIEDQHNEIREALSRDNQTIIVAEYNGKLIGYLGAYGGKYKRNKHCVYIVIGILQSFSGQGIGTSLLIEMEKWARQNKIHRIELTVMANNEAALSLYIKMGFTIEGIKTHSLVINNAFVNEYCMAKLLI